MELLIGSYTERLPWVQGTGEGVYRVLLDPQGQMKFSGVVCVTPNPTYLLDAGRVYAVTESHADDQSSVVAFTRDMERIGSTPLYGGNACHLCTDGQQRLLFAACYWNGTVAMLQLQPSGIAPEPLCIYQLPPCSGPHPERQQGPHAHMVQCFSADGEERVLVTDLGADALFVFEANLEHRKLRLQQHVSCPAGSGPRHCLVTEDRVYVLGELDCSITVFQRKGLEIGQRLQHVKLIEGETCPQEYTAAAIRMQGTRIEVSVRGLDEVIQLSIQKDGLVDITNRISLPGATPRDFCLVSFRDCEYRIVACQDSDLLVCYRVVDNTIASTISVPSPASVLALSQ